MNEGKTCKELGWKAGDKFRVLADDVIGTTKGDIVTLSRDDSSTCPYFKCKNGYVVCIFTHRVEKLSEFQKGDIVEIYDIQCEVLKKYYVGGRHCKVRLHKEGAQQYQEYANRLNTSGIEATLAERASNYGIFADHAAITQNIKRAMCESPNWETLSDEMKEALEMVAHKIGRILNGDPMYKDSWHDIIGYVKLIDDTLED